VRNGSTVTLGKSPYRYGVMEWGTLPGGWAPIRDAAGVAVDRDDNVYVFNRGEHPMIVFDREGNVLRSWGEGVFKNAHGVHVGPDGLLYCTDNGDHTVRKCTPEGKIVLTIGMPGKPAEFMGGEAFNQCTHTALSPRGDIYVSDGYGNARVHKYDPSGRLIRSWGEPGCDPGQFNLVHNICADDDGWVYVADRENHRVQVFDGDGRYETQWNNLHRPCGIYMPPGREQLCYIGELGPFMPVNRFYPNLGPRITIVDHKGNLVARVGEALAGTAIDQFIAPHGIAVDSRGDIYVGEVSWTAWPMVSPDEPRPEPLRAIRKLVRLS
jgi:DNA-binding beta-propeller fold protein YncE